MTTPVSRSSLSRCVSSLDVSGVSTPHLGVQGLAVEAAENGITVDEDRVAAEIFFSATRPDYMSPCWLDHSLSAV